MIVVSVISEELEVLVFFCFIRLFKTVYLTLMKFIYNREFRSLEICFVSPGFCKITMFQSTLLILRYEVFYLFCVSKLSFDW